MFRLELVSRLHQTPAIVRAQTGWRNAEMLTRDSQEKKVVENHRRVLMHEQQRADDATAQAESAVRGLLGPFASCPLSYANGVSQTILPLCT